MPEGKRGRPPFAMEPLLRIHFMQQWFTLSDPAMEEALHDMPLLRDFAGLGGWDDRLPGGLNKGRKWTSPKAAELATWCAEEI